MIYVYAIAQDSPALSLVEWPEGVVPGIPVELVRTPTGVVAITSTVPEGFAGPDSPAAADPVWLAARAVAHHEVICAGHEATTVLPLRWGTVFSGLPALQAMLFAQRGEWPMALQRVAGCAEVEVSLETDWETFRQTRLTAALPAWAMLPAGRRYLAERQFERRLQDQWPSIQAQAWSKFEELARAKNRIEEVAIRPNGRRAFLIKKPCKAFGDFVETLSVMDDLHFAISGVWPPYSFAVAIPPMVVPDGGMPPSASPAEAAVAHPDAGQRCSATA
ncbi:MAG: GvpL/GvpF family gas vesicle protein [Acidobacteria bacterium]|nr:GvpL/GvpF family gas vesicle protein [Acidobacteriota bacterium]